MDVAPKQKTPREKWSRKLVRQFGTPERGVRANAWRALERAMDDAGINWSDIGNWIEAGDKTVRTPKTNYSSLVRPGTQKAIETRIRIGEARKSNGGGNGHITLPKPADMAKYCHDAAWSSERR